MTSLYPIPIIQMLGICGGMKKIRVKKKVTEWRRHIMACIWWQASFPRFIQSYAVSISCKTRKLICTNPSLWHWASRLNQLQVAVQLTAIAITCLWKDGTFLFDVQVNSVAELVPNLVRDGELTFFVAYLDGLYHMLEYYSINYDEYNTSFFLIWASTVLLDDYQTQLGLHHPDILNGLTEIAKIYKRRFPNFKRVGCTHARDWRHDRQDLQDGLWAPRAKQVWYLSHNCFWLFERRFTCTDIHKPTIYTTQGLHVWATCFWSCRGRGSTYNYSNVWIPRRNHWWWGTRWLTWQYRGLVHCPRWGLIRRWSIEREPFHGA